MFPPSRTSQNPGASIAGRPKAQTVIDVQGTSLAWHSRVAMPLQFPPSARAAECLTAGLVYATASTHYRDGLIGAKGEGPADRGPLNGQVSVVHLRTAAERSSAPGEQSPPLLLPLYDKTKEESQDRVTEHHATSDVCDSRSSPEGR